MVTVSKVTSAFKDYIHENVRGGKARFKLAIVGPNRTVISKKSFEFAGNLTTILNDYAASKNGQSIIGYKIEKGVKYKISGQVFRDNYTEVVIKVTDIVAASDDSRLAKFLNEESRTCHDKNSRDRHVNEMGNAIQPEEGETPANRGEDA